MTRSKILLASLMVIWASGASADGQLSITARNASGAEGSPIRLHIEAPGASAETFVVISGLPQGAKLSAGVNGQNGHWLLLVRHLSDLTITSARRLEGPIALKAQLLNSEFKPLSGDVAFAVTMEIQGSSGVLLSQAAKESQ